MNWYGADVYVEVAFGSTWSTAEASRSYTDVTAYVRRLSTHRGRSSELSPYSPGTMTVSLDNTTRRFDVTNTAGAYYGNLLPMTPIRFRAGIGVTAVTLFTGYVLGWPITYPGQTDSIVAVSCVDGHRVLEQSTCPASAYGAAVLADSAIGYWPMQAVDSSNTVVAAIGNYDLQPYNFNSGVTTTDTAFPVNAGTMLGGVGYWGASVSGAITAFEAVIAWNGTTPSAGVGNTITVGSADGTRSITLYLNGVDSYQIDYRDTTNTRFLTYTDLPGMAALDAANSPIHVFVTTSSSNVSVYLNGVLSLSATPAASSPPFTMGSGVGIGLPDGNFIVSHVAAYSSNPSSSRILAHYEAGTIAHGHPMGEATGTRIGRILDAASWPSADRDLSTGYTVCGQWAPDSQNALSQIRNLADTEQGLFYIAGNGKATFKDRGWQMTNTRAITARATFGDSGSEIRYRDIEIQGNDLEHIRNVVSVSYPNASVTVKDATSIAAYGAQTDSVTATDLPTWGGWLARQLGNFRLRARKGPLTRVPSLAIDPRTPVGTLATYLPAAIDLELGDRVTVKRRPTGGTGSFSQDCSVQGIAHDVTPASWRTNLYLAPAIKSYTEAPYLTAGDATYGKIGAAAGNLVPY